MRAAIVGVLLLIIATNEAVASSNASQGISVEQWARELFQHAGKKDGLWHASGVVQSMTIASRPDDTASTRAILEVIRRKVAAQPKGDVTFCVRQDRLNEIPLFGAEGNCRVLNFQLRGNGGRSTLTCRSPGGLLNVNTVYQFTDFGWVQTAVVTRNTDLGGTAKPRPQVGKVVGTYRYVGPCPAAGRKGAAS